jgi:hypothetical protein
MAIIPIYSTRGDADAFLEYPYIFNRNGDWIGFVTAGRQVYSVLGFYVGYLTNDPRILRKASTAALKSRSTVPPEPGRISAPANIPLAPLMSEVPPGMIDVLLEDPGLLHPVDTGELREDLG